MSVIDFITQVILGTIGISILFMAFGAPTLLGNVIYDTLAVGIILAALYQKLLSGSVQIKR